jgi:glucosamine 6-phosphate synthetase-like amidotransferase/phosphosugar isomerase protein
LAVASDAVVVIPDHAVLSLTVEDASLTDHASGAPIPLQWAPISREMTTELGPFRHYMEKEIHEQPAVVRRLIDRA